MPTKAETRGNSKTKRSEIERGYTKKTKRLARRWLYIEHSAFDKPMRFPQTGDDNVRFSTSPQNHSGASDD